MVEMNAEIELIDYVSAGDIFAYSELDLEANFHRCVDHRDVPDHIYYEGYYHGLTQNEALSAINPRQGIEMQKEAAPVCFRAFLSAFKKVNRATLQKAVTGTPLQPFHEKGLLFADLAIQVHYGDAIEEEEVIWHADGPNSILHLAFSVSGKRVLHYRTRPSQADMEITQSRLEQPKGSLYLSTPFAFPHGVEYPKPECWEERIIAVQCRTMLTDDDYATCPILYDPELLAPHLDTISDILTSETVRMPTMAEVHKAEQEIIQKNTKSRSCCIM